MRIDLNAGILLPESQAQAEKSSRVNTTAGLPAVTGDSKFSSGQRSISALAAAALEAPEVRLSKVEALRKQMIAGTYEISSEQIAGTLLENLRR
jgi:flagellar biosynthesis anti-sigma factor FlgM